MSQFLTLAWILAAAVALHEPSWERRHPCRRVSCNNALKSSTQRRQGAKTQRIGWAWADSRPSPDRDWRDSTKTGFSPFAPPRLCVFALNPHRLHAGKDAGAPRPGRLCASPRFKASTHVRNSEVLPTYESSQDNATNSVRNLRSSKRDAAKPRVFKDRIVPHWLNDSARFWYRNDLRGGGREFILVDAERGAREPAFDHATLAQALSTAAGAQYRADKLPFDSIEFVDDARAIRFTLGDAAWKCRLDSYECVRTEPKPSSSAAGVDETPGNEAQERQGRRPRSRSGEDVEAPSPSDRSPDGNWIAFVKDHNVFIRS